MNAVIGTMANGLDACKLPGLTRPAVGSDEPPTLELVQFDLKSYAYACVAYVRSLYGALLAVSNLRNAPACDLIGRSIYEWAMQASYVDQAIRIPLKNCDFTACRALMDPIQTGNSWIKDHGHKYWDSQCNVDIPSGVRIKHLVKAYKAHQVDTQRTENVEDDYGYLSQHSHPNSCCFLDVTETKGRDIVFIRPDPEARDLGVVMAASIDWCLCIYSILGMANETVVRTQIAAVLKQITTMGGA